jgi:large subunit ribosomal protein L30
MLKIILKRSYLCAPEKQQRVLQALGLKKIGSSVKKTENKSVMGMINKVSHMVSFEKVEE